MAKDAVVSRELKDLREELSSAREKAEEPTTADLTPPRGAGPAEEDPEQRELQDQLRELANEVASYFDEAEKTVATHPTQSVIGAFVVGILVGRLLGKR